MNKKPQHTDTQEPAPPAKKEKKPDNGMVNDSLGTVDPADSTGLDEEKTRHGSRTRLPPRHSA